MASPESDAAANEPADAAPGDAEPADAETVDTLPDDLNYIVIEGVIGAGKTSLARLMARRFGAKLVLEEFDENPFLERFYEDRERWAFQTQLAFLASRFRQQKDLRARDLFHQVVVSDYAFDKDRIFAHQNLEGDELQLYETLYKHMEPNTPTPDLVIYLQSTPERLMQNIEKRGRPYEEDMDPAYIEELHEAYNYYFFRYTKSPLLIVNAAHIDFVDNEEEREELLHHIATVKHRGTTYVNPLASAPTPHPSDEDAAAS
jgi:deoxyadenosine/deoxycytidine kinase